jgi:NAD-dependent SIR2 family protein deacetylase
MALHRCPHCENCFESSEVIEKDGRKYCLDCGEWLNPQLAKYLQDLLLFQTANNQPKEIE